LLKFSGAGDWKVVAVIVLVALLGVAVADIAADASVLSDLTNVEAKINACVNFFAISVN
jgi:hypothetical protein